MKKNQLQLWLWCVCLKKFFLRRILKVVLVLLLVTIPNPGLLAQPKITLKAKNLSWTSLLKEIERQTGMKSFYPENIVGINNKDWEVKRLSVQEVLECLVEGTNLKYRIEGHIIFIYQENKVVDRYHVTGDVYDFLFRPLPGANILLENTMMGVVANKDGHFELTLPKQEGYLLFSFVGCMTQKVHYIAGIPLKVTMEEKLTELEEMKIIAQAKRNEYGNFGAVAKIDGNSIKDIPSSSFVNLLQGRISGLNIMNVTGFPGTGDMTMMMRGCGKLPTLKSQRYCGPLFIIDGIPVESGVSEITGLSLAAEFDPLDFDNGIVLKDASAAYAWGARAADGIILINTPKGKLKQQHRFSAGISHTVSFSPALPPLITGDLERNVRLEAIRNFVNVGVTPEDIFSPEGDEIETEEMSIYNWFLDMNYGGDLRIYEDSTEYNYNTNLFDFYFRPSLVTNVYIQSEGGSEKWVYHTGVGYYDEDGILKHTGFSRLKFINNVSYIPSPNLDVHNYFYYTITDRTHTPRIISTYHTIEGKSLDQIPEELFTRSTLLPGPGEPLFEQQYERWRKNKEYGRIFRFRNQVGMNYKTKVGINLKLSANMDYAVQYQNLHFPQEIDEPIREISQSERDQKESFYGQLAYNNGMKSSHCYEMDLQIFYQIVNNSYSPCYAERFSGYLYPETEVRPRMGWYGLKYKEKYSTINMVNNLTYSYKSKLFMHFAWGLDISNKFHSKERICIFPSASISYVVSKENFMNWSKKFMDCMRIRISCGKTGRYGFVPSNKGVFVRKSEMTFLGYETSTPDYSNGYPNPDLKRELSKDWNIGVDLEVLHNRIILGLEYYGRYAYQQLYQKNYDMTSAYSFQWRNGVNISNRGLEVNLLAHLIKNDVLNWNIRFNIAINHNILMNEPENRTFQTAYSEHNMLVKGRPLGGLMVLEDHGFYDNAQKIPYYIEHDQKHYLRAIPLLYRPGDRILKDRNGDWNISDYFWRGDYVNGGSPLPRIHGGISSQLKWGKLDLEVLFNYQGGRGIINAGKMMSIATYMDKEVINVARPILARPKELVFWQKAGDKARLPKNRAEAGLNNFSPFLLSCVEKVWFVKWKMLKLGYRFPIRIGHALKVDGYGFVSVENLLTISNYSGPDPETVDPVTGIDYLNNYPLARKLTLGFNVSF